MYKHLKLSIFPFFIKPKIYWEFSSSNRKKLRKKKNSLDNEGPVYLLRSLAGSCRPWVSYPGGATVSLGHGDSVWVHCFPSKCRAPARSAGIRHQNCQSEEVADPGQGSGPCQCAVPGARLHLFLGTAHSEGWETEWVHSLNRRAMEKEWQRFI